MNLYVIFGLLAVCLLILSLLIMYLVLMLLGANGLAHIEQQRSAEYKHQRDLILSTIEDSTLEEPMVVLVALAWRMRQDEIEK